MHQRAVDKEVNVLGAEIKSAYPSNLVPEHCPRLTSNLLAREEQGMELIKSCDVV